MEENRNDVSEVVESGEVIVEMSEALEIVDISNLASQVTGMENEAFVEILKDSNLKRSMTLELERQRTIELSIQEKEAKIIEATTSTELEKAKLKAMKEEKVLLKGREELLKEEKAKADKEADVRRIAESAERQRLRDIEQAEIKRQVQEEVHDLREYAQRELMIKSLNADYATFFISQILEENIVWAGYPLVTSDGSEKTAIELMQARNRTVPIADVIEPKKGYVATLVIERNFFITIKTPLRGGEKFTVHFTPDNIISIIREHKIDKQVLLENLIDYLSEPSYSNISALKAFDTELKVYAYLDKESDFVQLVYDKIDEKILQKQQSEIEVIMKDYHCEILKGKPTFLDRVRVVYSPASLVQMFSGESNEIVTMHPITKKTTRHNPAKLYLDSKMYEIFDGVEFSPSNSISSKFNTYNGLSSTAKKLLYISPFISYVNQVGCSGDKAIIKSFWSYFAKIVHGNINKYSAMAVVSDEDELVDLLLRPFRRLLEDYYFRVNDKKQLSGVNTHFEEKLLVEIDDEYLMDKGAVNVFEDLVKNSNFQYQVTRGTFKTKPNYSSCLVTSRDYNFVSKMAKKKLLIVTEVSSDKADDFEYLNEIHTLIDDVKFAPSLMYYLQNFNYKKHEQLLIRPTAKVLSNEEIEESLSIELQWFYERLKNADFANVALEALDYGWKRYNSKDLHEDFLAYAKSVGKPSTMKRSVLGTKISKILKPTKLIKAGQKLKDTSNAVDYGPLLECRIAFEKYTGLNNPEWVGNEWQVS